jgi:predicted nuclease with TOPRIM domain
MNLFETLVVAILAVYVLAYLIFVITGRINSRKERKEDIARADKSLEWEEQLRVLTKRMGEISTEYHNCLEDNRRWKEAYNVLAAKYQELKSKYEIPDETQDA